MTFRSAYLFIQPVNGYKATRIMYGCSSDCELYHSIGSTSFSL